MRQALFITYFWPPSGKATVHWPLYITKHLPKLGWQPCILTVDEDTFSAKDYSLLGEVDSSIEVVKTHAWDPFSLYRRFLGKRTDEPLIASETISLATTDWRHRLSIWIRMNLFVPDARVGWYFSAVKGGRKLIESEKPSVIVTIGPPHSTHLIGKSLSKKYKIPHIPMLIDPWVDIVYYRNFKRSASTLALDNYFERTVLNHAKDIVFVTKSSLADYCKKYPLIEGKSHVFYWGYNEEQFSNVKKQHVSDDEIILHAGNIFDYQNMPGFWKNVRREIDNGRKLRLRFVGSTSPGIKKALEDSGLSDYTDFKGFLPYAQVVQEMMNASYLLVCASERRHVPGKLFEYLRTGNKVIAFGNDNEEVAQLLSSANAGKLFRYDYAGNDLFNQLISYSPDVTTAKQFSRDQIARELVDLLDTLQL